MLKATNGERQLLHAIDMMMVQDWASAKAALEALDDPVAGRLHLLVGECQQCESDAKRSAAFMRHEIGNVLAIALANVEGMADGVLDTDAARLDGVAEALHDASALLDRWRRGLLEPVKPAITIGTFNICALIAAQYAGLSGLAEAKGVRVAYYPCGKKYDGCTEFRGDSVAIAQILRNVLINAVRYTPPGGNVEIVCDRPDGELSITIRDSGPGIAAEDVPHVFEEGYCGDDSLPHGSGLGLTVVANLLRAFGGSARVVESGRGGTTFSISLPAFPVSS